MFAASVELPEDFEMSVKDLTRDQGLLQKWQRTERRHDAGDDAGIGPIGDRAHHGME
jgi:hypothetical protein